MALLSVVVTGLMLGVAPPSGGGASPPPASRDAAPAADQPRSTQVTLITGDTVRVDVLPDGRVQPGVTPGGSAVFRVYERAGDTYVVPLSAQPYLDSGLLDHRLFNVSLLVAQEYDDLATGQLPLIIEYDRQPRTAATLPGVTVSHELPSVAARAVTAGKDDLAHLWHALTGDAPADPGTRLAAAVDTVPAGLAGGVQRVWLDATATPALDRSTGQVGAPHAWAQGLDGSGVRVAVLDTGIDMDHPDLAGKVAAARSFTPDGTVVDRHGHGTHVAATVAGGTAGDDGYVGVAPGADLLIGKVLSDSGPGLESWIIAGMEWAVEAGADVVNLSLGSLPTDGTDPLSLAVNRLSEDSGALFVVAAGNAGPSARTVSAPATADAALAVGNNTRDGTLHFSSSRGARLGDNAVKPEVTAPGVGIVAARPGGGHQPLSGTSMAAPHVAGAAAILAQQHPDWTAPQLKAALVATSVPLTGATVWQQGAGQISVTNAVDQTVRVSDAVLNLGYLDLDTPDEDLIRSTTLTYRNDGTDPVTLSLDLDLRDEDGAPAPAGTVTVEPGTLELAPGEAATVTVTLDATDLPGGEYAGRIVADGAPAPLATVVGFYRQQDMVDVTISLTDRHGQPAGGRVTLLNYERGVFEPGGYFDAPIAAGQELTLRLPRATYSITAHVATLDGSGRFLSELSLVFEPQRTLDRNQRLVLDARSAQPVEFQTPRTAVPESVTVAWTRAAAGEGGFFDSLLVLPAAGELERLSVTPTDPVTDGEFDVHVTAHLAVPALTVQARGEHFLPTYFVGSPRYEGAGRLPVVDVGQWPDGANLTGAVALMREDPDADPGMQVLAAAEAGARLALVTPAQPGLLRANGFGLPIPAATLSYEDGERLRDGLPGDLRLTGVVASPYTYDLVFHSPGRVSDSTRYRVLPPDLATIDARYHGDGQARPALLARYPVAPCQCSLVRVYQLIDLPYARTEYVTATGGAVWSADLQAGLVGNLRAWNLAYQPNGRYEEGWGAAPLAPTAASAVGDVSTRDGDLLRLRVSAIADAAGRSGGSVGDSRGVLSRDGEVVAELFGGFGDVPVPPSVAEYRLEVTTTNGAPEEGRLATESRTTWTFRSGHTADPQPLPLLSPRLDLPVSIGNAMDPRRPAPAWLSASYPDHTPVALATAQVWVSYGDEGWEPARVVPGP
ncbi:MAG TPA: S8 family serine peptidase, partial [Natronosporangium sp.]|nr:S8 family serine peptidase [Natronosporangium sp.]